MPSSSAAQISSPANVGFGPAQPAVDAVLRLQSEYTAAVRDPASHTADGFDALTAGQAKQAFDQSFAEAKRAGVVYRGTPPSARIRVIAATTDARVPQVDLVNCPLQSGVDPFRAYHAKTDQPLPTPSSTVKPPYGQTAKVFKVNGRWVVTQFSTDASKTCSA